MKAKVTLHTCDLVELYESLEAFNIDSVDIESERHGHYATIVAERHDLELYLELEYCVGMDHETIKSTFDDIEDL